MKRLETTLFVVLFCASASLAADFRWSGAGTGGMTATDATDPTTQWNNPANWWEGSVPVAGDTVYLSLTNRGYCNAPNLPLDQAYIERLYVDGVTPEGALHIGDGASLPVRYYPTYEYIGYDATGRIVQDGGTHLITSNNYDVYLYLGYSSGSYGEYEMLDGTLNIQTGPNSDKPSVYIGFSGQGLFKQTSGAVSVSTSSTSTYYWPAIYLGYNSSATGTYELSGGSADFGRGTIYIGRSGRGEFIQSGGTLTGKEIYLGEYNNSAGTYELSGGTLQSTRMEVGRSSYSEGEFDISGGTANLTYLSVGISSSAQGTLDISGSGVLNVWEEKIGKTSNQAHISQATQTGGTHTVTTMLTLGYNSGSAGQYALSGGTLSAGAVVLGLNGTGMFTQDEGTLNVVGELHLGHNNAGVGTMTINGGNVNVGTSEYIGMRGHSTLTQTGGQHLVNQNIHLGYSSGSWGRLAITGGTLSAGGMYVGGDGHGELRIGDAAADVRIAGDLAFGPDSVFEAVAGAEIHMTGSALDNHSTNGANLDGLGRLTLIFEGGADHWATFEAAAEDLGNIEEGFTVGNFVLDCLTIGGADDAKLRLVDLFDNSGGVLDDAVYVNSLVLSAGSTLDMNGLNLYYHSFTDEGGTILNGTPVPAPEPATFMIMGLGILLMRRRRR